MVTVSEHSTVRAAQSGDYAALADIYNHYVINTVTTFEEEPVDADEMGRRVQDVAGWGLPWLVLAGPDQLEGYACAVRWKFRSAYRHSVETTIYLRQGLVGHGRGALLYGALLDHLRDAGMHTAMGGIALPNDASVALHEKLGFGKVAHFAEVGHKFGRRIDVGYWQVML